MNRRAFLRIALTGISSAATDYLFSRLLVSRANQLESHSSVINIGKYNFDVLDFYRIYSSNTGGQSVHDLDSSFQARDSRAYINGFLAKDGYTDYSKRANFKISHSSLNVETYFVRHENGVDACAPYFADYEKKARPTLEAAAMLGLALATEAYKERHNASELEVAATFVPLTLDRKNGNMENGRIIGGTKEEASNHPTERGRVVVTFRPTGDPTIGVRAFDHHGGIIFRKSYPFSIIPEDIQHR